jgi:hypothetical protein
MLPSLAHLTADVAGVVDPDEPTLSRRAQARAKPAVRECTSIRECRVRALLSECLYCMCVCV